MSFRSTTTVSAKATPLRSRSATCPYRRPSPRWSRAGGPTARWSAGTCGAPRRGLSQVAGERVVLAPDDRIHEVVMDVDDREQRREIGRGAERDRGAAPRTKPVVEHRRGRVEEDPSEYERREREHSEAHGC